MSEGDAARGPLGEGRIDVSDLEPQRAAVRVYRRGRFLQEYCEAVAVLKRNRAPVGYLELDFQAQRSDIPIARTAGVGHRDAQVVELHHGSAPSRLCPAFY